MDATLTTAGPPPGTVTIRGLLQMLWRGRLTIIAVLALVLALAALLIGRLPPAYLSSAMLVVSGPPSTIQVAGRDLQTANALEPLVGNAIAVLQSERTREVMVDRLDLTAAPALNPFMAEPADALGRVAAWASDALGLAPPPTDAAVRAAVMEELRRSVEVVNPRGTHTIVINVSTADPALSARIAGAMAERALEKVEDARADLVARERDSFEQQASGMRAAFEAAERRLEEKRRELGLFEGAHNQILAEQLSGLTGKLIEVSEARASAQAQLARVGQLLERGTTGIAASQLSQVLDSETVRELRLKEAEAERRLADLSTQYGDKHPLMVAAQSELVSARTSIREEIRRVAERLNNDVRVAERREAALLAEKAELEESLNQQLASNPELNLLRRDAESARESYNTFLTEGMRALRIANAGDVRMTLASPPVAPIEPAGPNRILLFLLAALAGGCLGVLAALLRENLDSGIRSSSEAEALTGHPTLAMVPRVTAKALRRNPEGVMTADPRSTVAEAIRNLYINTGYLGQNGQAPRTVLVTSALPNEGKTMVALSLARQAALAGRKTICVDLDLRQTNRRHAEPGPARRRDDAPPDEKMTLAISSGLTGHYYEERDTGLSKLVVTAEGQGERVPLDTTQIHTLLINLTREFELVVIDSPPVLCFADAALIASLSDVTLYVIRWATTSREKALEGLRALSLTRARVGGTVITQLDPARHAEYGYGDSGIYYGDNLKYYRTGSR